MPVAESKYLPVFTPTVIQPYPARPEAFVDEALLPSLLVAGDRSNLENAVSNRPPAPRPQVQIRRVPLSSRIESGGDSGGGENAGARFFAGPA